jgi:hypothetical protein
MSDATLGDDRVQDNQPLLQPRSDNGLALIEHLRASAAALEDLADQGVAFLKILEPLGGRTWFVLANNPNNFADTRGSFIGESDDPRLKKFLIEWNGRANIFFHLNEVSRDFAKAVRDKPTDRIFKAADTDMRRVLLVATDFDLAKDPNKGRNWSPERLRDATIKLATFPGAPAAAAMWSGGGTQVFWHVREMTPEAWHKHGQAAWRRVQNALGSGTTNATSQVMRMPFCINMKDEPETARDIARKPALAYLLDLSGHHHG